MNTSGRSSKLKVYDDGRVRVLTRYLINCDKLNILCRGSLYPYLDALKNSPGSLKKDKQMMQMTTVEYDPVSSTPHSIALKALKNIIQRLGNENYRPYWLLKDERVKTNISIAVKPYDPEMWKIVYKEGEDDVKPSNLRTKVASNLSSFL
jgi:hypothetical protein